MTIDIDKTWNPKECSLDEHRMNVLKTLEQPGFGSQAKLKPETSPPVVTDGMTGEPSKENDRGE